MQSCPCREHEQHFCMLLGRLRFTECVGVVVTCMKCQCKGACAAVEARTACGLGACSLATQCIGQLLGTTAERRTLSTCARPCRGTCTGAASCQSSLGSIPMSWSATSAGGRVWGAAAIFKGSSPVDCCALPSHAAFCIACCADSFGPFSGRCIDVSVVFLVWCPLVPHLLWPCWDCISVCCGYVCSGEYEVLGPQMVV